MCCPCQIRACHEVELIRVREQFYAFAVLPGLSLFRVQIGKPACSPSQVERSHWLTFFEQFNKVGTRESFAASGHLETAVPRARVLVPRQATKLMPRG